MSARCVCMSVRRVVPAMQRLGKRSSCPGVERPEVLLLLFLKHFLSPLQLLVPNNEQRARPGRDLIARGRDGNEIRQFTPQAHPVFQPPSPELTTHVLLREQGRRASVLHAHDSAVLVPLGKSVMDSTASRDSLARREHERAAGPARGQGPGFSARGGHPEAGAPPEASRGERGRPAGSHGGHAVPSGPFTAAYTFHKKK